MKKITLFLFILFISQPSFGADQSIEMLNKLGKEHMVYSQKIVNIEAGDYLKGQLPDHPNHPKGRNPYAHVAICVKSKFQESYKDIEDEKFQEVIEYIEYLKNNPS